MVLWTFLDFSLQSAMFSRNFLGIRFVYKQALFTFSVPLSLTDTPPTKTLYSKAHSRQLLVFLFHSKTKHTANKWCSLQFSESKKIYTHLLPSNMERKGNGAYQRSRFMSDSMIQLDSPRYQTRIQKVCLAVF